MEDEAVKLLKMSCKSNQMTHCHISIDILWNEMNGLLVECLKVITNEMHFELWNKLNVFGFWMVVYIYFFYVSVFR